MTLRVLHLSYDDVDNPWVSGGGPRRLHEIYRRLIDKVEVTIVTGSFPGARDTIRDGVRYRRLGACEPYPWSRLTYAVLASRASRQSNADVIALDASPYTPILLPQNRAVAVSSFYMPARPFRPLLGAGRFLGWWERHTLKNSPVLSANTQTSSDELRDIIGIDRRISIVGAGVSAALFDIPRQTEHAELPRSHPLQQEHPEQSPTSSSHRNTPSVLDASYLLYVGRLDILSKGIDTLLAALSLLANEGYRIPLHIAGSGHDEMRVRRIAEEYGVASQVVMRGLLGEDTLHDAYAKATILLVPSRFETFCMSAAEGMAAGLPIIASSIPVLSEVIGDAGYLIPPDDPAKLARAIQRLLANPELRQKYGNRARERARAYTWDQVAQDHYDFLKTAAQK